MKNSNLFLLTAALFALISCGTANRSAYYNGSQMRNSIYYTPQNRASQAYVQEQEYLQDLQQRTTNATEASTANSYYDATTGTKNIYVGDNNEVNITYNPGVTYTIMDDQESYEARLRKFDSPFYTINIDFNYNSPWYSHSYPWYSYTYPWYSYGWYPGWRHSWYNSWYRPGWGWYDPFYDPFYDPWWGVGYYPGYYPGYHPGYYPGFRPAPHPGYHPAPGPGAAPGKGRDIYYGKRNSSPTYRETGKGYDKNMGNSSTARPETGSATRRPANATQINNSTRKPATTNGNGTVNKGNNGNNQYRRVAPSQQTKGKENASSNSSANRKNNPANNSSNSSYNRGRNQNSNSTFNRNSGSQNRSTFSNGNNYGGGNRNAGSNAGGGSTYRRR